MKLTRATPKTQAALLESMEEKQVTVDGITHPFTQSIHGFAPQKPNRI